MVMFVIFPALVFVLMSFLLLLCRVLSSNNIQHITTDLFSPLKRLKALYAFKHLK